MHKSLRLLAILVSLAALASFAAEPKTQNAKPKTSADSYPLTTCLVSDEPLSSGDFIAYTHKAAGKPDRVVRLCCEGCIEDFRINPAKFLQKLDAAEAAAAKKQPAKKKKS